MNTKSKPFGSHLVVQGDSLVAAGAHLVKTSDDELILWHDKQPQLKVKISASRLEGWVKRQLRGGMFA